MESIQDLIRRAERVGIKVDESDLDVNLEQFRKYVDQVETDGIVENAHIDIKRADLEVSEALSSQMFSSRTQKHRKLLVLASAISLAMSLLGLLPKEIQTFGLTFEEAQRISLLHGSAAVVFYFLIMFLIPAWFEGQSWKRRVETATLAFKRVEDEALRIIRERGPVELLELSRILKGAVRLTPKGSIVVVFFIEFVIPLGLAIAAVLFALI